MTYKKTMSGKVPIVAPNFQGVEANIIGFAVWYTPEVPRTSQDPGEPETLEDAGDYFSIELEGEPGDVDSIICRSGPLVEMLFGPQWFEVFIRKLNFTD
jgi:hypothetical protein